MDDRRHRPIDAAILGVWAVAILVRTALIPHAGCVQSDSVTYLEVARLFSEEGIPPFHPIYPPLYPAIAGCLALLGFPLELGARLASALLGSAVVLPVAWIGHRTYGPRVARYAAAIVAVHPVLVTYGTYVLTEATYTTLLAAGITFGLACVLTGRPLAYAAAGLSLGLASLLRPEALAYLPFLGGVGLYRWRRCGVTGKRTLQSLGLLLGPFLVVTLPYAHYMKETTGTWTLTGKTSIMLTKADAVGEHDLGVAAEKRQLSGQGKAGLLADLVRSPMKFVARSAMNLHLVDKYVIPGLLPPLLLAAVALGLTSVRASRPGEAYLLATIAPSLPVLLFLVEDRIFLPLVPVAAIWAGLGSARLCDRLSDSWPRWNAFARFHPILIICCLSLLPYTFRPLYRIDRNDIYRRAGVWIRANQPQATRVAFPKPWIAYYAAVARSGVPTGSPEEVARELAASATSHLVVDSRITAAYRPDLAALLFSETAPGLESVARLTDPLGQIVRIFRIRTPQDIPGE